MSAYTSVTGWNFPPEFTKKGNDVQMVSDETEIKQSLEILFTTTVQERLLRSEYGCDLKKFLFEEVNQSLVTELESMLMNAVYTYESRIEVQEIKVTGSETDAQMLLVEINYQIIGTDSSQSLVLPLQLY
jgi:uncharacterized protein